ncbi:MAG: peptidoglycan recognition family protein [Coriobacteriales bacterium]|nr:peptidoglycan recognition family protein [Coriobacteriales bacterium]
MTSQKPALKPLVRIGSLAACGLLVVTLGACAGGNASSAQSASSNTSSSSSTTADKLRADLHLAEDYRQSFVHGDKPAEYQKYIVLHDTEVNANAAAVINSWDNSGAGAAAHFIVDRDGSITQCVPLDKITHHAGFGDTGHGAQFGVEDDSRDDKVGTTSIGDKYADYGMNSYSIGIEMSHVGGKEDYPQAQLDAVDKLIAYIDEYYGFESQIIDHKMWRSTNSDTSAEFATYLANYQATRTHTA